MLRLQPIHPSGADYPLDKDKIGLWKRKGKWRANLYPSIPISFHRHSRAWCPYRVCQIDYFFLAVSTCPEVCSFLRVRFVVAAGGKMV